jgi:hypothetical protein
MPTSGIVPWTSAEVILFTVRHWLGISFEGRDLVLRPNLFPEDKWCRADLRFRSSRIRLAIDKGGEVNYAMVNKKRITPRKDGSMLVPSDMLTGELDIKVFLRPGTYTLRASREHEAKGEK